MREGILGVLVLLLLLPMSCRDSDDDDPERDIATVVANLNRSFEAGELREVCAGMTKAGRARVAAPAPPETCARELGARLDPTRRSSSTERPGKRRVTHVEVTDRRAVARVTLSSKTPGLLRFARDGDRWKLDDVAVVPALTTWRWAEHPNLDYDFTAWRTRGAKRIPCPPTTGHGGGCVLAVNGTASFLMTTAVGDFIVAKCRSRYRLHIGDPVFVATHVTFSGEPPCQQIDHCRDLETGLRYPWLGNGTYSEIADAPRIQLDICVNTPMGRIRGFLFKDMGNQAGDWTASSRDYLVGTSSVHIEGSWDLSPDAFGVGDLDRP